jgi:hypothetical protein
MNYDLDENWSMVMTGFVMGLVVMGYNVM